MKREQISDALNMLNDDIIEDTSKVRTAKKKSRVPLRWCAAAVACLILIAGGAFMLHQTHDGIKVISHYDSNSAGCYVIPSNGQIMYERAVEEARDRYSGKDVTFLLAFNLFENEENVSEEKREEEYRRLISDGYKLYSAERWTYQGKGEKKYYTVVVGCFTEDELANFKSDPSYGYFFHFAKNGDSSPISIHQDNRITVYATNHS